jgi:hypothetical protein
MPVEEGLCLLNYVLPALRFLRVRSVLIEFEASFDRIHSLGPVRLKPSLRKGEPEGLTALLLAAARHFSPDGWRDVYLDGELFVDVRSCSIRVDFGQELVEPQEYPLVPTERLCGHDYALVSFLKGVRDAPLGHLALADWLEERSGPSATSAAFRESEDGPPAALTEAGPLSHAPLRWDWLDRNVLLYLSRTRSERGYTGVGFVMGVIHGPPGGIPLRWSRWLADAEVARRLGDEMPASV